MIPVGIGDRDFSGALRTLAGLFATPLQCGTSELYRGTGAATAVRAAAALLHTLLLLCIKALLGNRCTLVHDVGGTRTAPACKGAMHTQAALFRCLPCPLALQLARSLLLLTLVGVGSWKAQQSDALHQLLHLLLKDDTLTLREQYHFVRQLDNAW